MSDMIYGLSGQARLTATGLLRPWGKVRRLRSQADLPLGATFCHIPAVLEIFLMMLILDQGRGHPQFHEP